MLMEQMTFSFLLPRRLTSTCHFLRWCDCIALPDEVDSSDEASFKMQIIELAFTSLQLLMTAIFDEECEPLFSLAIYGHIIGMFELNNLKRLRKILDALGDDYSICCQGTAFFPLHSCMNHTCCPNAKAFKREEINDHNVGGLIIGDLIVGEYDETGEGLQRAKHTKSSLKSLINISPQAIATRTRQTLVKVLRGH